jgi:hypothetical protein
MSPRWTERDHRDDGNGCVGSLFAALLIRWAL